MPLSGTLPVDVYYLNLDSTLGCFVIDPETGPYIVLRENLDQVVRKQVYDHLIEYYRDLPDDSPYWLFQHVICFEDLVPPEALPILEPEPEPEAKPLSEPDFIVEGRGIRLRDWRFTGNSIQPAKYRVIGDKAG